jgi:cysteinyl-tRNA synthetase
MKTSLITVLLLKIFVWGDSLCAQYSPASFAYILQAESLSKNKAEVVAKLSACDRDLIVLDAHFSGDESWNMEDIQKIRAGRKGRRVVAYISIGEAEDYRSYWHHDWDADRDGKPDTAASAFLLAQNPEWKGNYRVKYWRADWQEIILKEVERVMLVHFDGVYLDIVDGFESFEQVGKIFIDDRANPETGQSYRRDMVDWVKTISAHVHKSNTAALVIPQNGTQLLSHADFLGTVDAVGVEDLFTNGDKLQKPADIKYRLDSISPLLTAHRPVLDIEYPKHKEHQILVREQGVKHGLVWLVTDRQLKTLGASGK